MTTLIQQLKALHEQATPPPWKAQWNGAGHNLLVGKKNWMIGQFCTDWPDVDCPIIPEQEVAGNGKLTEFIRNNLPAIIQALESAEGMREAIPQMLDLSSKASGYEGSGDWVHARAAWREHDAIAERALRNHESLTGETPE